MQKINDLERTAGDPRTVPPMSRTVRLFPALPLAQILTTLPEILTDTNNYRTFDLSVFFKSKVQSFTSANR